MKEILFITALFIGFVGFGQNDFKGVKKIERQITSTNETVEKIWEFDKNGNAIFYKDDFQSFKRRYNKDNQIISDKVYINNKFSEKSILKYKNGKLVSELKTDRNGKKINNEIYFYDENDRIVEIRNIDSTSIALKKYSYTDNNNFEIKEFINDTLYEHYIRKEENKKTTHITKEINPFDKNTFVREFITIYNDKNQKIKTSQYYEPNSKYESEPNIDEYEYYQNGKLKKETYNNFKIKEYNQKGHITKDYSQNSKSNGTETIWYNYEYTYNTEDLIEQTILKRTYYKTSIYDEKKEIDVNQQKINIQTSEIQMIDFNVSAPPIELVVPENEIYIINSKYDSKQNLTEETTLKNNQFFKKIENTYTYW